MHDRRIDSDTVISCPYLGLVSDPSTHCPFATSSHRCFRWPTPQPVDNKQQGSFCLSAGYSSCHWYAQAEGHGARPNGGRSLPTGWHRPAATIAALCLLALLIVILQPWSLLSPSSSGSDSAAAAIQTAVPTQAVAPSPEAPATDTPLPTVQPTPATPEASPATAPAASPQPGSSSVTPQSTAAPAEATSTISPRATATQPPTATLPPGTQAHSVKQGDNLYDIAKLFGVTVEDIMEANGLTDRSYLRVGQRLVIPEPSRQE